MNHLLLGPDAVIDLTWNDFDPDSKTGLRLRDPELTILYFYYPEIEMIGSSRIFSEAAASTLGPRWGKYNLDKHPEILKHVRFDRDFPVILSFRNGSPKEFYDLDPDLDRLELSRWALEQELE